MAEDTDRTNSLIMEAKELFIRVKKESKDVEIIKQAQYMEASCYIALGDSQSALGLLEGMNKSLLPVETLLASAYKMEGKINEAKSTLQIGIYQYVIALFSLFPFYLMMCTDEPERYEEVLCCAFLIDDVFEIKQLLPAALIELYVMAAYGYIVQGNLEESLNMLQKFTELITSKTYQWTHHSDNFFDSVGDWLDELYLGAGLIKNEKTIKQNMVDLVINNPVFSPIANEYRFQSMLERLNTIKGK